jgi:inosose dehydratase
MLRVAQCPASWGVEEPHADANPPWESFLDEVAAAGYEGVELGPLGYLPGDGAVLGASLAEQGLAVCAGYVMEPLADPDALRGTIERTRMTAALLRALGADRLVLIDDLHADRSATAGRSDQAARLDARAFDRLVDAVRAVAEIATDEFGLLVVFHPHVGTHVEFRDEIDRLMEATDVSLCVDTGHSVYAGIDPVELYTDYAPLVRYMHLKDVDETVRSHAAAAGWTFEEAVDRGIFCPVGKGTVDYPALFAELRRTAYDGWIAVEQDRAALEPGSQRALADARESREYIRGSGLAAAG